MPRAGRGVTFLCPVFLLTSDPTLVSAIQPAFLGTDSAGWYLVTASLRHAMQKPTSSIIDGLVGQLRRDAVDPPLNGRRSVHGAFKWRSPQRRTVRRMPPVGSRSPPE